MLNIRLELHDRELNAHKYWSLQEIGRKTGMVLVRWGRCLGRDVIGGEQIISLDKAMDKLRQKRRKGYRDVE